MVPVLPNFFLAGAPKAGTTSLYHYLLQHPSIYMSPIKEPSFFASEVRRENFAPRFQAGLEREAQDLRIYLDGPLDTGRFGGIVADWGDYCRLFRNVRGQTAIGEASVCYLWSPTAARNIAQRIPDARILVLLRDPSERAFSQYLHGVTNGVIRCSFRQHIEQGLRHKPGLFDPHYPFLEFGFYAEQLERYFDSFPRKQIHIHLYEDYRRDTPAVLAGILRFLEVDPGVPLDTKLRHLQAQVPRALPFADMLKRSGIWQRGRRLLPSSARSAIKRLIYRQRQSLVMDPADQVFLRNYYRADVEKLEGLLGRDLRAWLPGNGAIPADPAEQRATGGR